MARINQIETHLLPTYDSTIGANDRDKDLIRAYCLLCHAEFEDFIEQSILKTTEIAFNKWSTNKENISAIIFSLALSINENTTPHEKINKAYNDLKKRIEKNHGIKEHNLTLLIKPIGFLIDPTLQATLNDFGKTRGDIAHTSFHAQQALDATIEKNTVKQIVDSLKDFDLELIQYEANDKLNSNPLKILGRLSLREKSKFSSAEASMVMLLQAKTIISVTFQK